MISLLCYSTFIFTNIRHVVADQSGFVFGVTGSTVTIFSQLQTSAHNPVIIWYHESPVGDINFVCLLTQSILMFERGQGTLPDAANKTSLTLWSTTVSDAGRYFAMLYTKRKGHVFGSAQHLVVTDPSGPVMRLYRGADNLGSPLLFCEVTGAGVNWSDPYWQIEANGAVSTLDGTTARRIGSDGVFTRWSIIRPSSALISVTCLCHQINGTRVLFRSNEMDARNGATACDWLVLLSPLCLLLCLLTVAAAILWTRRLRRLRAA